MYKTKKISQTKLNTHVRMRWDSDRARRALRNAFQTGDLVFFAGSGISLRSGVPSTGDILSRTVAATFPTIGDLQELHLLDALSKHLIAQISQEVIREWEPEIFYEKFLEAAAGIPETLHLWRSLVPSEWRSRGMQLQPNLNHYAIVDYSAKHNVPILTTNFDHLFEIAAQRLGRKYRVVRHFTRDSWSPRSNELVIIKMHGTVPRTLKDDDSFRRSLYTTMTDISRTNFGLASFLAKLSRRYSLTIVGYSGRDIDIFPNIRRIAHGDTQAKPLFWINRFLDRKTQEVINPLAMDYRNAVGLGDRVTILGDSYPDDFFRLMGYKDQISEAQYKKTRQLAVVMLDSLRSELERKLTWSSIQHLMFFAVALRSTGRFKDAHRIFLSIHNNRHLRSQLAYHEEALLLQTGCDSAHHLSRFAELERYAGRLCAISLGSRSRARLPGLIMGLTMKSEAVRMRIPTETFILDDLGPRLYSKQLRLALRENRITSSTISKILSDHNVGRGRHLFLSKFGAFGEVAIRAQHYMIEHGFREVSMEWNLRKANGGGSTPRLSRSNIKRELERLRLESLRSGYSLGVANYYKFLSRMSAAHQVQEMVEAGRSIAPIIHGVAVDYLLSQNIVEMKLREAERGFLSRTQQQELKSLMLQTVHVGRESENPLNVIKSILAIAELNRIMTRGTSFRALLRLDGRDYREELLAQIAVIQAPLWKDFINQLFSRSLS